MKKHESNCYANPKTQHCFTCQHKVTEEIDHPDPNYRGGDYADFCVKDESNPLEIEHNGRYAHNQDSNIRSNPSMPCWISKGG